MGFKPKVRKAKAKEKARVEWVMKEDREDEIREKQEAEEEAEEEAKAKADAEAKAEADAKSVADAEANSEAHAHAKSEPESKSEVEAKAVEDADAKSEPVSKSEVEAKAVEDAVADADAKLEPESKSEVDADAVADADPTKARNDWRPKRRRELRRYFARLEECGPFDVDYFPDSLLYGMVRPFLYEEGEVDLKMVDNCVRHAIQFAKKEKKMELEDPKVVRVHYEMDGHFMFYITFHATDKKKYGMSRLYEAKVLVTRKDYFRLNPNGIPHVRIMRLKNNQQKKNKVAEDCCSKTETAITYLNTQVF